ncbi:MAG: hypothetical protein LBJ15_17950 [Comamonas sp.]|jgi:hypothetical protein|uniref:hypothetical protein n=1 Tax=Comamonas sp. TaxID=34028 RepID=UPI002827A76B|nr:hypothetical protein [Comamonas sp.]MDR0215861.1 hypothetical protein [Comamonas sp.]
MTKSMIALAAMALLGSGAAMAASGGSSNAANVAVGNSNHLLFGGGNAGLKFENSLLGFIDIAKGPVNGSNTAIASKGQGAIMTGADAGAPVSMDIAQVWNASATQGTSKFMVNSVRQINTFALAPQFGGLVIGQVADAAGKPLAVGSGVYFGEWAPRAAGTPPANSTNLNMASSSRTVWYAGDNPTTAMPTLVGATYNVIGIQGVGTAVDNLPTAPKLYGGTLTANYMSGGGAGNSLIGTITNGTNTLNFAGTTIASNGKFVNGNAIEGQFYNNASALAGIYKGGTAASNVAFGGSRSN